jgi:hypothetical protein
MSVPDICFDVSLRYVERREGTDVRAKKRGRTARKSRAIIVTSVALNWRAKQESVLVWTVVDVNECTV